MTRKQLVIYCILIGAYLCRAIDADADNFVCEPQDKQTWFVNKDRTLRHRAPPSPARVSIHVGDASVHIDGSDGLNVELVILERTGPILLAERPGEALWPNEQTIARLLLWIDGIGGYAIFSSMWLRFFADEEYTEVNMNVTVYQCDKAQRSSAAPGGP
jgi:hypothetical protein